MSNRMPEDIPDKMSEDMSDRIPEDLPITKHINVMVGMIRNKIIFIINYFFRYLKYYNNNYKYFFIYIILEYIL